METEKQRLETLMAIERKAMKDDMERERQAMREVMEREREVVRAVMEKERQLVRDLMDSERQMIKDRMWREREFLSDEVECERETMWEDLEREKNVFEKQRLEASMLEMEAQVTTVENKFIGKMEELQDEDLLKRKIRELEMEREETQRQRNSEKELKDNLIDKMRKEHIYLKDQIQQSNNKTRLISSEMEEIKQKYKEIEKPVKRKSWFRFWVRRHEPKAELTKLQEMHREAVRIRREMDRERLEDETENRKFSHYESL